MPAGERRPSIVIGQADLVPAAKANPAAATRRQPMLNLQIEIPESLIGNQTISLRHGVPQNSAVHFPSRRLISGHPSPCRKTLSLKQLDRRRRNPAPVIPILNRRRSLADPPQDPSPTGGETLPQ